METSIKFEIDIDYDTHDDDIIVAKHGAKYVNIICEKDIIRTFDISLLATPKGGVYKLMFDNLVFDEVEQLQHYVSSNIVRYLFGEKEDERIGW